MPNLPVNENDQNSEVLNKSTLSTGVLERVAPPKKKIHLKLPKKLILTMLMLIALLVVIYALARHFNLIKMSGLSGAKKVTETAGQQPKFKDYPENEFSYTNLKNFISLRVGELDNGTKTFKAYDDQDKEYLVKIVPETVINLGSNQGLQNVATGSANFNNIELLKPNTFIYLFSVESPSTDTNLTAKIITLEQ